MCKHGPTHYHLSASHSFSWSQKQVPQGVRHRFVLLFRSVRLKKTTSSDSGQDDLRGCFLRLPPRSWPICFDRRWWWRLAGGFRDVDDLVMLDVTDQVAYQPSAKRSGHEDEQHWKRHDQVSSDFLCCASSAASQALAVVYHQTPPATHWSAEERLLSARLPFFPRPLVLPFPLFGAGSVDHSCPCSQP